MKDKSIKLNAALNGIRTILNLFFPLITFPYISRVLSVDEIGMYNFSFSIVSYFMLIAELGFSQYSVREGTRFRESREDISTFASKIFSLNLISTFFSYFLLVVFLLFSSKLKNYSACILIISIQVFFTTIGTEWLYSIFEEYKYITVRSILFRLLSIVMLFAFVRNEGDYLKYAGITIFACVGSNLMNFIHAKKYCNIRICFPRDWKNIMAPVLIIFASNIAIQIYVNLDVTMLGYFKNDYCVGIYSVSTKIYTIIKNVLTAVLLVTIPRFSLYASTHQTKEYNGLLIKVVNVMLLIAIPSVIGLCFLSKNIVLIIAGDDYLDSVSSLCILSGALLFAVFNVLFNQCVLLPHKRELLFLKCTIFSAVLNVVLNLFMIPLFSEVGAALTTLASEATLCIMLFFFFFDIVGQTLLCKKLILNIISVCIAAAGVAVCCLMLGDIDLNLYLRTIIASICSVGVFVVLLVIMKNEVLFSFLNSLKRKIKKD